MDPIKKIAPWILIGLLPLMSAGCFDNTPASDVETNVVTVSRPPVQVNVPKAWREVKESDFQEVGKDVVLAYSSLSYINGFANNISVTKETLSQSFSSQQYADANLVNSAKYVDDYVKLSEKDVTIKDANGQNIPTKIHTFEGRFDKIEKQRKYLQLYAVKGMTGYTMTITIPLEETDLTKYENLLTSFRFVQE